MKKLFFTFVLATLVASCTHGVGKVRKPGVTTMWVDDNGDRHRKFVGDDGSYSHHVNGKLIEMKTYYKGNRIKIQK